MLRRLREALSLLLLHARWEREGEMVLPTALLGIAVSWLLSCYTAAKKLRNYGFLLLYKSPAAVARSQQSPGAAAAAAYSSVDKCPLQGRAGQTVVFDVEKALLRSPSLFPFFMLVAFEGGSVLRAFLLLLCYPLVWALTRCGAAAGGPRMGLCVMAFVTFCGLRRRDAETAARAVLPKFFLEDLHRHAYEAVMSAGRKVAVTTAPRVMVEWFLREYLGVDDIVSADLDVFAGGSRFTGMLSSTNDAVNKSRAVKELLGGDAHPDLGLSEGSDPDDHLFLSLCKEAYVVTKEESNKVGTGSAAAMVVPRKRYPKPLVFHDGRLAILPSPSAAIALFVWLPFSVLLCILRIVVATTAPCGLAIFLGACIGNHLRVNGLHLTDNKYVPQRGGGCREEKHGTPASGEAGRQRGVLYVCNHRTLMDPVVLSISLGKPLTAVTYSLSKVSEILSPIPTVKLCRDRERDGATMHELLGKGDLVVCPEGTTCRESCLLRFSPLFAELTDEIAPVGMESEVTVFYGTTAGGYKLMDPFFFLMNPRTMYRLHFLGRLPREATCAGGRSSRDVANDVQRRLADEMGFERTTLTRRDKYLVLAGNDGVVDVNPTCSGGASTRPHSIPPASAHVSSDVGGGDGSSSSRSIN